MESQKQPLKIDAFLISSIFNKNKNNIREEEEKVENYDENDDKILNKIIILKNKINLNCDIYHKSQLSNENSKYIPMILIHGWCDTKYSYHNLIPKIMNYDGTIINVTLRGLNSVPKLQKFPNSKNSKFSIFQKLQKFPKFKKSL